MIYQDFDSPSITNHTLTCVDSTAQCMVTITGEQGKVSLVGAWKSHKMIDFRVKTGDDRKVDPADYPVFAMGSAVEITGTKEVLERLEIMFASGHLSLKAEWPQSAAI
jgi:hypothetical protein